MEFEKMTDEEALEILRSQKGRSNTPGGVFYQILADAMPGFKGVMEKHTASMMAAGYNIGRIMRAAEKNPEDRKEFIKQMHEVAQRINASSSQSSKDDEKEKK